MGEPTGGGGGMRGAEGARNRGGGDGGGEEAVVRALPVREPLGYDAAEATSSDATTHSSRSEVQARQRGAAAPPGGAGGGGDRVRRVRREGRPDCAVLGALCRPTDRPRAPR
jgi:hypothetical protein